MIIRAPVPKRCKKIKLFKVYDFAHPKLISHINPVFFLACQETLRSLILATRSLD